MVYLGLAILSLVFALLGFLVHAFYFSKQGPVGELERQLEGLKMALSVREKENADDKNEVLKTTTLAGDLERQLEQRNEQVKGIQAIVKKQEEEIRALQEAASEARASIARPEPRVEPEVPIAEPVEETKETKIPLWKDNLNNILGVLDKFEKGVKK